MDAKILAILFCFLGIYSFGQTPDYKQIDIILSEWNKSDTPGFVLGVIKGGEMVYNKGFGIANMEYNIPISEKSVFRIASTSKQFTAACIVILEEQGKLSFADKLSKYFPEFPEYADSITILNLLNHTSGIRDYPTLAYLIGLKEEVIFQSDQDLLELLNRQTALSFKPNDEFLYCNSGYWMLGQIVERVSGKNLAEFAKECIFEPLGMKHTHFHNDNSQIVKNRATGYSPSGNTFKINETALNIIGDGGVFTSVEDLKIWDNNYYNSNILSANFWETMEHQAVLNSGDTLSYAKGVKIEKYRGQKIIEHGGRFVGFRCQMIRFPDAELTIIILANRSDINPDLLIYQVADILLKDGLNEITTKQTEDRIINNSDSKFDKKQLEKYCGNYWNDEYGYTRKIYLKNDTLIYSRSKSNEVVLSPINFDEFELTGSEGSIIVKFDVSKKDGRLMFINQVGSATETLKEYHPISLSYSELKQICGKYYSKELDVNYVIKNENNQLKLFIREKDRGIFYAIEKKLFTNNQFGIFRFKKNETGEYSAFVLDAGRVKGLEFEKNRR